MGDVHPLIRLISLKYFGNFRKDMLGKSFIILHIIESIMLFHAFVNKS